MDWKKLSTEKIMQVYNRLFLSRCYLCDLLCKTPLCHYCQHGFADNVQHCLKCKRPTHTTGLLCGHCQTRPPTYQHCIAPYRFEGIVKTLIHQLKFHQGHHYSRPLTYLLSEHLLQHYATQVWPEQLIYVPSHPKRIKERGFCQTRTLSRQLIRYLKPKIGSACPSWPAHNPLKKIVHTQAQHSLTRKARLKTPKNAYQVKGNIAKHVALFDDVMTTGSTIEHCVQLLRQAGAERVDVWVIARTPDKTF
ncbi:ComF family protein [Marinomonas sp. IMCC 4694]|uniref:ComF family protein n=1 Tax=Marinomonas sp. IMCC 4694 TaxID=2605432 RepID=UPI0011E81FEA|nr:ComF family protein [Marinomonas sp. IMCC 4694]TYL48491.1 ComF family protein [Marinomonas sp. IMCC 4694]